MGSENGHFRLLSVHRRWVGGSEKVQKPAFVIFKWSLTNLVEGIPPIDLHLIFEKSN